VSPRGKVLYVSPVVSQIWGLPVEEFEKHPYPQFFATNAHPDDLPDLDLEGMKSPGYTNEFRIIRPDKSVRWVRVTTGAVVDTDMQVTKVVGHGEEITARKTAELELIRGKFLLLNKTKSPRFIMITTTNKQNSEDGPRGNCARTNL